jgi:hypothetical protein
MEKDDSNNSNDVAENKTLSRKLFAVQSAKVNYYHKVKKEYNILRKKLPLLERKKEKSLHKRYIAKDYTRRKKIIRISRKIQKNYYNYVEYLIFLQKTRMVRKKNNEKISFLI